MPELPEVQTTVDGLQDVLPKLKITAVWSDLPKKNQKIKHFKETLKDVSFFNYFSKEIIGETVVSVERRAKNILINLKSGEVILIHMKMTGHLLYGTYEKVTIDGKETWVPIKPESLKDPFNKFIHVVFTLSNKKYLALSDSRKFAKVTLLKNKKDAAIHFEGFGPEPLDPSFTFTGFSKRLDLKPNGKIKQVLMDQTVIAGIGNIYSDEMLWLANIHPLSRVKAIPQGMRKDLYSAMKKVLKKGIDFGGDSTSDYRQINGLPGKFHHTHNAYRLTGTHCKKPGCTGIIKRIVVGSRSAHFCSVHQKLLQ